MGPRISGKARLTKPGENTIPEMASVDDYISTLFCPLAVGHGTKQFGEACWSIHFKHD